MRERSSFAALRTDAGPLIEILPASPGDALAALGFALTWGLLDKSGGPLVWASPDFAFAEEGAPNAPGLAKFGLDLSRLIMVRTKNQIDALWAGEEALRTPQATALIIVPPTKKPLSLTATRRLLLNAEKHKTRCVLLRLDAAPASAAWTRWRVKAAPSQAHARELGAPAFAVDLIRNRAGPSGLSWRLEWNAHAQDFTAESLALPLPAAPRDRSPAAVRAA